MWTRRDLLRAVGAGATLAALGPAACGGAAPTVVDVAAYDPDRVRDALRAACDRAGERLAEPLAFAGIRRRVRAVIDLDQRGLFVEERRIAVVGGRARDGRWLERGTDDLSADGIAAAAVDVASGDGTPPLRPRAGAHRIPRDHTAVVRDPRAVSRRTWLDEADALSARVAAHASSRIVYRASWLVCDDDESWIVRAGTDEHQRLVRGQVGAGLVAWQGQRPIAGEATAGGRWVPTAGALDDDALARAAADALTLYTPGSAPAGPTTLVLAPAIVATLLDRLLAMPALAATVRPPALLALTDDPTAADGFAGYFVDDDGEPARATTLASGGQPLAAPGPGSARRAGPRWYRTIGAGHLVVAPGAAPAAALETAIVTGLALDGLRDLRLDADGRLAMRVARAYEIERGQRSGRVWGDVELHADVGALLGAAIAVSQERVAIAIADDGPARSALVPWLVTRGEPTGGAA